MYCATNSKIVQAPYRTGRQMSIALGKKKWIVCSAAGLSGGWAVQLTEVGKLVWGCQLWKYGTSCVVCWPEIHRQRRRRRLHWRFWLHTMFKGCFGFCWRLKLHVSRMSLRKRRWKISARLGESKSWHMSFCEGHIKQIPPNNSLSWLFGFSQAAVKSHTGEKVFLFAWKLLQSGKRSAAELLQATWSGGGSQKPFG